MEFSINELKNLLELINENKEELKFKIQNIFTWIRSKINDREELLLEVDKIFENIFVKENEIQEIDKLS